MAQGFASLEGVRTSAERHPLVRTRLLLMMVLELFIWGAWLPLIFDYLPSLGFNSQWQQPLILSAFALASFVGMFFSNQFADRNFSAERFMAVSHLVGGLAMLGLFYAGDIEQFLRLKMSLADGAFPGLKFTLFFSFMLVHCLFYVPTLSITNSISFTHLKDPQKEFGLVRLGGTLGWIAAAWPFVFIMINWATPPIPKYGSVPFTQWLSAALANPKKGDDLLASTRYAFLASGIASLVLAVYSLTLPHTPPKKAVASDHKLAWLEAMKLLKVPFVLVLFIVTFFDAAVQQSFFLFTNGFLKSVGIPGNWVTPAMSIGQVAEVGTMAILGLVLKRLGWRTTMIIGILGHTLRFGIFAFAPYAWLAVSVNIIHGICYAFFFATVYIFVDTFFPKDARTSAQGLFNFLIFGLGPIVANFVGSSLGKMYTSADGKTDFRHIFIILAATALGAALLLMIFFHPPKKGAEGDG